VKGFCGTLALANSQTPTQQLSRCPSSTGQGKNGTKTSWVEVGTGRLLTRCCHRQNRLHLVKINLIYYQVKQIRVVRNRKTNIKTPFPSAVPCAGLVGTGWNRLCPAGAAPVSPPLTGTPCSPRQCLGSCTRYTFRGIKPDFVQFTV